MRNLQAVVFIVLGLAGIVSSIVCYFMGYRDGMRAMRDMGSMGATR
jgi:membrane protein DedA with SNARE-associated domain